MLAPGAVVSEHLLRLISVGRCFFIFCGILVLPIQVDFGAKPRALRAVECSADLSMWHRRLDSVAWSLCWNCDHSAWDRRLDLRLLCASTGSQTDVHTNRLMLLLNMTG
jgi:hypothetical protein